MQNSVNEALYSVALGKVRNFIELNGVFLLLFTEIPKLTLAASLVAQMVKNLFAMQEQGFYPWVRKIPWRRAWQPTPVLLPGESHGQRSLVGYSPGRHTESDMPELLTLSFYTHYCSTMGYEDELLSQPRETLL